MSLYELLCSKLNRQMTEFEHILKNATEQVKKTLKPIVVFQREICRIAQDLATMDSSSADLLQTMERWNREFPCNQKNRSPRRNHRSRGSGAVPSTSNSPRIVRVKRSQNH